nr:class I SAM-dependent methyltransferase [Pseudobutyrivibrio xylanivorans]
MNLYWGDLEQEATWDTIPENTYDKVIAHYLLNFFSDMKAFVKRAAKTLKPGGMFSVNYYGVVEEYGYWERILKDAGVNPAFAVEERVAMEQRQAQAKEMLSEFFREIEVDILPQPLRFTTVDELMERLNRRYPNSGKYIKANSKKLEEHFAQLLEKDGQVVVDIATIFYHCYK